MLSAYITLLAAILIGSFRMFYMREKFAEAFLFGFLICCVGFTGLYAFMGHFFFADKVAQGIGWPAGNPFQKEVAFTNLGIGILGFLCIWIRGNFWAAAVIMNSTFLLGAAYIHYMEIIQKANLNPLNAGTVFYFDILIPVITLGLLIASRLTKSENK